MTDEISLFARTLGALILSFFALLAIWTLLVAIGRGPNAEWMPDLMRSIAAALIGIIGGFGLGRRGAP